MKRISTLILVVAGFTLTANAQTSGFYHVQNTYTDRYMIMTDNTKGATVSGTPDLAAITTSKDKDNVFTHPGAVCYIENVGGNKVDVKAQNTCLHDVSKLYANVKQSSNGYELYGTAQGITIYLGDKLNSGATDSWLVEAGNNNRYWNLLPIDNSSEYIGIKPDVQDGDGNWWGSIYCGFSFKLQSSGMEVWYVDAANGDNFSLKQWTNDVVPATMPVLIKCSSKDYANNKIKPVTDNVSEAKYATDYHLYGVYFDRGEAYNGDKHIHRTDYDSNTMRVIGVSSGKLVFEKASSSYLTNGAYLPHNKCYLNVPSGASSTLTNGTVGIRNITAENQQLNEGTYNLAGQRMADGETLRPGIYIKDGKKVVIK